MNHPKWRYSFRLRCPNCGHGHLFKTKHSYQLNDILKMNDRCENCREDFSVEPGFYHGAMYMSYIITCAMCIALLPIYLAFNFSRDQFLDNAMYYIGACILLLVVSAPYVTQFSRAVWLTVHIKYFKKHG
jgi:uncharacterized protein (DUF983 family)